MRLLNTRFMLLVVCLAFASNAFAKSVTAIALFQDRAMLSIDGGKAKIVKAGSTYKGVKVISSNTSKAVIEVDQQRQTLRLNGTAVLSESLGASANSIPTSVTLYENDIGFFETQGQVNGRSVRFLVDTGANTVVFNSRVANRLNIDYLSGQRGFATTASGQTTMYSIVVDEISIGGIRLKNIRAGVIEGGFPRVPLLGMTFLGKLKMNRNGGIMVLEK